MSIATRIVVNPARGLVAIVGIAALIALSGCASGDVDNSGGGDESNLSTAAPEAPTAAAPETACPDGFVDAWGAAAAVNYGPDFTFREATVAEFTPPFLAPFLDGGCAIFASGTNSFAGFFSENYYGFSPEASGLDDVTAAFEEAGYAVSDPATPAVLAGPNGEFAGAFAVGGDAHLEGDAAIVRFFPTGMVFY